MNKFLKDLENELKKLKISKKDIEEILGDHKEMIEAAKNEGLDDKEIEIKFGNPKTIAQEIHKDAKAPQEKKEYNFENVDSCVKENSDEYSIVKTFPVIEDTVSIDINLISDDISLTTYEGDSIQVYQRDIKKIDDYIITLDKGIFTLKREKGIVVMFSFSSRSGHFLVLVPNNINIEGFNYKTVSGDAEINGIVSKDLKVKSTSGDVDITNLETGDTKLSTVSGDFEIARFKAKSFEVSLISGDLEMEKASVEGMMYFHSVSGDLELFEVECAEARLKTISGDLEGKEFYPKEVTLKSISGDISITNRSISKEITIISKKTVSGEINIS